MSENEPTWKCLGCGSICNSDPAVKPVPCDHCGSENVVPYAEAPEDAPEDKVFEGDMD